MADRLVGQRQRRAPPSRATATSSGSTTARPAAWFNGYGGQRFGINLQGGRIALLLNYDERGVLALYKAFN